MKYYNKLTKILAFGITIFALGIFFSSNFSKDYSSKQTPTTKVNIETLKSGVINTFEDYEGTLISRYSVAIQPQVTGQIVSIPVRSGDKVVAGQTLIVIDQRKQEASLNSSKADAESMAALIEQAKSNLTTYKVQQNSLNSAYQTSKLQYERYKDLYAKKTVSKQDLEQYLESYNKAKSDMDTNLAQIQSQKVAIKVATSNYKKAIYSIKEQEAQLAYHRIVAPYSGIIGDIPVKVGQYITPETKLLSITQNNQLELNVGLPAEKVFKIHKGLCVQILDDKEHEIASSVLSFVSPEIDANLQTILVKAVFNNQKEILKSNQTVKVRVTYNKTTGILVPTEAITHLGGQDFAFVVQTNGQQYRVKQQPVTIGQQQNDKYVVIKGLNAGNTIVTQGVQKIYDGAAVNIASRENI